MLNNYRREALDATPDKRLTSLLEAAAAPTEPGPLPGEVDALAAFRASQSATRRPSMISSLATAKVTLAAALSGLVLTGGVGAAAAAGSLPGAAQDTASELLGKVGVTVPGANAHSAGHADQRGTSDAAGAKDSEKAEPGSKGKGAVVSEIAKSDLSGVEKGAAVSGYASGGKSKAGVHGPKSEDRPRRARAPRTATLRRRSPRSSPPPARRRWSDPTAAAPAPPMTPPPPRPTRSPRPAPRRPTSPARATVPLARRTVRDPLTRGRKDVCPRRRPPGAHVCPGSSGRRGGRRCQGDHREDAGCLRAGDHRSGRGRVTARPG